MKKEMNITVFGCEPDEAAVFNRLSFEFGVTVSLIREAVSENNVNLADGCQCVSISHKAELSESLLLALKEAGVKYICTRSIGFNHIDIQTNGNDHWHSSLLAGECRRLCRHADAYADAWNKIRNAQSRNTKLLPE